MATETVISSQGPHGTEDDEKILDGTQKVEHEDVIQPKVTGQKIEEEKPKLEDSKFSEIPPSDINESVEKAPIEKHPTKAVESQPEGKPNIEEEKPTAELSAGTFLPEKKDSVEKEALGQNATKVSEKPQEERPHTEEEKVKAMESTENPCTVSKESIDVEPKEQSTTPSVYTKPEEKPGTETSDHSSSAELVEKPAEPIETIPAKVSGAKDERLETIPAKEGGTPESTTEGKENLQEQTKQPQEVKRGDRAESEVTEKNPAGDHPVETFEPKFSADSVDLQKLEALKAGHGEPKITESVDEEMKENIQEQSNVGEKDSGKAEQEEAKKAESADEEMKGNTQGQSKVDDTDSGKADEVKLEESAEGKKVKGDVPPIIKEVAIMDEQPVATEAAASNSDEAPYDSKYAEADSSAPQNSIKNEETVVEEDKKEDNTKQEIDKKEENKPEIEQVQSEKSKHENGSAPGPGSGSYAEVSEPEKSSRDVEVVTDKEKEEKMKKETNDEAKSDANKSDNNDRVVHNTPKPDNPTNLESSKDGSENRTGTDPPKQEVSTKSTQKQSSTIMSKVKHSIVKAKKAITGKSSSKTVTAEAKGNENVK